MTLQIGEPQLSDIERAALLHNLGRFAMPDDLLRRAETSRSAAERAQLRSYPLHGYAMLKNVPFLAAASFLSCSARTFRSSNGNASWNRGSVPGRWSPETAP